MSTTVLGGSNSIDKKRKKPCNGSSEALSKDLFQTLEFWNSLTLLF
jgi:hypothetical protein